jgi:putative Mn2+ efflux pump MntP
MMPLVGVAIGAPLGRAIGGVADYVAAGALAALGAYMLLSSDSDDEERLLSMTERGVSGAGMLGISISLDELAIGFGAGPLRLPLLPLIVAIAAQAFIVTQIGVRIGSRVGARWRESAEGIAGVALITLGAALVIANVTAQTTARGADSATRSAQAAHGATRPTGDKLIVRVAGGCKSCPG